MPPRARRENLAAGRPPQHRQRARHRVREPASVIALHTRAALVPRAAFPDGLGQQ
jgi:hypothetical protein